MSPDSVCKSPGAKMLSWNQVECICTVCMANCDFCKLTPSIDWDRKDKLPTDGREW